MNEFTLKLNTEQINTVLAALAELPFKVSNQLISEIATQCRSQQTAEEVSVIPETTAE